MKGHPGREEKCALKKMGDVESEREGEPAGQGGRKRRNRGNRGQGVG